MEKYYGRYEQFLHNVGLSLRLYNNIFARIIARCDISRPQWFHTVQAITSVVSNINVLFTNKIYEPNIAATHYKEK